MASPRDPNTGELMPLVYYAPPADYTFKELKCIADMAGEQPRSTDVFGVDKAFGESQRADRLKEGEKKLILLRKNIAIKLTNNKIESIENIAKDLAMLPNPPVKFPGKYKQTHTLIFTNHVHHQSSVQTRIGIEKFHYSKT